MREEAQMTPDYQLPIGAMGFSNSYLQNVSRAKKKKKNKETNKGGTSPKTKSLKLHPSGQKIFLKAYDKNI